MGSALRLLLLGALFGALLLALLATAEVVLAPDDLSGLLALWLSGAGLGLFLASLGPSRLFGLVLCLALLAPLSVVAGYLGPNGPVADALFGASPSVWAWRAVLFASGLGAGGALQSRFGLALLGGSLGIVVSLVAASRGLSPLVQVAPLATTVLLLLALSVGWRRRRPITAYPREVGWDAEDPPVLRARLGGLMLIVVLAVALVLCWLTTDLLALTAALEGVPASGPGGPLLAAALVLALGLGVGRLLQVFSRRLPGAELAPLFLLFGATAWFATRTPERIFEAWQLLGQALRLRLPSPIWDSVYQAAWSTSFWSGPSLLSAGAALALLPQLSFPNTPDGRRRRRRQVGGALFLVGAFVLQPVTRLVLVEPGPAIALAGLVGLGGLGFLLIEDLRDSSVVAVGRPFDRALALALRGAAGLGLALVCFVLATLPSQSSARFEGVPGRQLAFLARAAGHTTADLDFGLAAADSGRRAPFLTRLDWTTGETRRFRRGGSELTARESGKRRAAATRLARLLGNTGDALVLGERSELVPGATPAWLLDLSAAGPDRHRAATRAEFEATRAALGPEALVCSLLPLELQEADFEGMLDAAATCLPWATAWLVDGFVFVVGANFELPLDLAAGSSARRVAASFVGQLVRPIAPRGSVHRFDRSVADVRGGDGARQRARNLETLLGRRTELPLAWASLLGEFHERAIGRALADLRVAAAWVAYDRRAAPGSLALESWQERLDRARLDAGLLAPEDPELQALDAAQRADAALYAVRGGLLEADPRAAVSQLLAVQPTLAGRADYELLLAAAFELAGNASAARLTWQALGPGGPALLAGSERWLTELGFVPPAPR